MYQLSTSCRSAGFGPLATDVVFFSHCSPVQLSRIVPSPVSVKQPDASVVVVVVISVVVVDGEHAVVHGKHLMVIASASVRDLAPFGTCAVILTFASPGPSTLPFLLTRTGIVASMKAPQAEPSRSWGTARLSFTLRSSVTVTRRRLAGGVQSGRLGSVWLMQRATRTSHRLSPPGPVSQASPSVQRTILFFCTRSLGFVMPATSSSA